MQPDNRPIESTHLTPQVIEKIGIVCLISSGTLTVLTILLGIAAVFAKMKGLA